MKNKKLLILVSCSLLILFSCSDNDKISQREKELADFYQKQGYETGYKAGFEEGVEQEKEKRFFIRIDKKESYQDGYIKGIEDFLIKQKYPGKSIKISPNELSNILAEIIYFTDSRKSKKFVTDKNFESYSKLNIAIQNREPIEKYAYAMTRKNYKSGSETQSGYFVFHDSISLPNQDDMLISFRSLTGFEYIPQVLAHFTRHGDYLRFEALLDGDFGASMGSRAITKIIQKSENEYIIMSETATGDGGDNWKSVRFSLWTKPTEIRELYRAGSETTFQRNEQDLHYEFLDEFRIVIKVTERTVLNRTNSNFTFSEWLTIQNDTVNVFNL